MKRDYGNSRANKKKYVYEITETIDFLQSLLFWLERRPKPVWRGAGYTTIFFFVCWKTLDCKVNQVLTSVVLNHMDAYHLHMLKC